MSYSHIAIWCSWWLYQRSKYSMKGFGGVGREAGLVGIGGWKGIEDQVTG